MERKSKRAIIYLIVFMMVAGVFGGFNREVVYAEDVSIIISIEPMNIQVGDTVTATVTVSGDAITSFQIYLNYSSSVLEYQSAADAGGTIAISGTGATTISYNFKAIAEGNASFTTTGSEIYGENGATLSVSHAGAVFSIGGEEEEEEYEASDETEEEEEDDGTIKVAGEKYTLTYKDYFPAVPADYTLSYVSYKGEDIYAYQSPTNGIKIVSLTNSDYESKWFVYNEDDETFSPYIDYELVGIKYTIIEKPKDVELPAGFKESLLTLNDTTFVAYTDGTESGLYLVYAVNQYGMSDFYYYDTDEGSLTKYNTIKKLVDAEVSSATNATIAEIEAEAQEEETDVKESESSTEASTLILPQKSEDEDGLSKDMLKRIIKTFIIVFIVLCIIMIILVIRNSNLQNKLLDYEDEDENESFEQYLKKESQKEEKPLTPEEKAEIAAKEKIEAEKAEKKKISRNKGYAIGEETGEIQIEEAQDNNAGVNVPPASDKSSSKIEDAMKERPFGIDSAFDVVTMEEAPEGDHVLIESEENLVPSAGSETVNSETVQKVWTEKNEELRSAEEEAVETAEELEQDNVHQDNVQQEAENQQELEISEAETEVLTASMLEPANNVMNKISEIRSRDKKQAAPEKEPEKIVLPNFDEEEE